MKLSMKPTLTLQMNCPVCNRALSDRDGATPENLAEHRSKVTGKTLDDQGLQSDICTHCGQPYVTKAGQTAQGDASLVTEAIERATGKRDWLGNPHGHQVLNGAPQHK